MSWLVLALRENVIYLLLICTFNGNQRGRRTSMFLHFRCDTEITDVFVLTQKQLEINQFVFAIAAFLGNFWPSVVTLKSPPKSCFDELALATCSRYNDINFRDFTGDRQRKTHSKPRICILNNPCKLR